MAGLLKRGKIELTGEPTDLFLIDPPELHTSDDVIALLKEADWLLTTANQLGSIGSAPGPIGDLAWDAGVLVTTAMDALRTGVASPLCRRKDDAASRETQRRELVCGAMDLLRDDSGRYAYALFLLELAGYGPTDGADADEEEAA